MRTMIADRGMGEPISLGAALASGKKVPPDATNLLMEDHRVVLGWFSWYEQSTDSKTRERVARSICIALRAHMAAEEELFYPQVADASGDEELVQRALQEHRAARGLMERIENAARVDEAHASLMSELRAEIEAHVEEEETRLFPAVRESEIDRYALGGAMAARRVDRLFESLSAAHATGEGRNKRQQPREYPVTQISQDVAHRYFIIGLKDAHATVKNGRTMVDTQIGRLKHYPRLKEKLQSHLKEKDAQLERLEGILEAEGERPSKIKDAAMTLMANVSSKTTAAAGDEVLKSSFATLGLAKAEAAAFETLILFAQAAGVDSALRPLQQCLSEERGMAAFIEENLRGTGMGFLQLESQGESASR
jgi:ferritin-like metal-binding protein YciE